MDKTQTQTPKINPKHKSIIWSMTDQEAIKYMANGLLHCDKQVCREINLYQKERRNQHCFYSYMLTLTIDPKKYTYENEKPNLIKWIHQIKKRKDTLNIVRMFYSEEGLNNDKHQHIHLSIITTEPLKKNRFTYKYGILDFSSSRKSRDKLSECEAYLQNYTNKENDTIDII